MNKIKKIATISFMVMIIVTVAGCSSTQATSTDTNVKETKETTESTTATEGTTSETQEKQQDTDSTKAQQSQEDDSMVFGKVTAIDGKSLTLAVGKKPQAKDMGNGEAPSKENDKDGKEAPNGEKPDTKGTDSASTGEAGQAPPQNQESSDGQKSDKGMPADNGKERPDMSSLFEESGETITITVDDESIITIMSGDETTTGSLSDIKVDTILNIKYDDSKNISSIIIQK